MMANRLTNPRYVRGGLMAALAAGALMTATTGHAAFLDVNTLDDNVSESDSVTVNVVADPAPGTTIGAFDIDLAFDSNLLAFNDLDFGGNLSASTQSSSTAAGVVTAAEKTLTPASDLESIQPSVPFTLFSVTFDAEAAGSTLLDLNVDNLRAANTAPISVSGTSGLTVDIEDSVDVPAPAPLALLAAGVAGLLVRRGGRSA